MTKDTSVIEELERAAYAFTQSPCKPDWGIAMQQLPIDVRPMANYKCHHCGVPMPGASDTKRFCTPTCREAHRAAANAAKAAAKVKKKLLEKAGKLRRVCAVCNTVFEVVGPRRSYCSQTCGKVADSRRKRSRYKPKGEVK